MFFNRDAKTIAAVKEDDQNMDILLHQMEK